MESFSLLKYWRTPSAPPATNPDSAAAAKPSTKTIVTAAAVSPYSSDGEDGPYYDLEFALPDPETDADGNAPHTEDEDGSETGSDDDDEEGEEGEIDFALAADDQNAALSPSDELFFKGDLVSIQPSNILLNASEENSKFPVFLVKSATKFRVLLLKLKKSRSSNWESGGIDEAENNQGKSFAVKFNVEELPLVNLFTRDASSKDNNGGKPAAAKNNVEDSEERKVTKEVMQKYLKMVKPFYIRVSKRYVEKLKFSGHLSFPGGGSKSCAASPPPPEKGGEAAASNVRTQQKQGTTNLQAGLRVVRKHLGKSRSASAAVSAASPGKTTSERRDDSLLQVQDGIQGAILHCKRSFNASRDVESSSVLCRSVSDPSYEKSVMKGEAKGCKN